MKTRDLRYYIKDIGLDFIGSMLLAIGLQVFTVPNQIVAGGVTGISTIVNYFTGLPIGTLNVCINIPLLVAGYRFVGKRFLLDTLKVLLISAICIDYIVPNLFPVYRGELILVAIYGAVFVGTGLGLIIMRGSSTGGTDILVCIIQTIRPHLSFGTIMMVTDFCVVLAAAVVFKNFESVLYAGIFIFISGECINRIVLGADKRKMALVVTGHHEAICQDIKDRLNRSSTILDATGAYKGNAMKMIVCAIGNNQFPKLKEVVFEHDPSAFVMITDAGEILGEGFKSFKK